MCEITTILADSQINGDGRDSATAIKNWSEIRVELRCLHSNASRETRNDLAPFIGIILLIRKQVEWC